MIRTLAIILATLTFSPGSATALATDNWPPLCNGVIARPQHVTAGTSVHLLIVLNKQALAELRKANPKYVLKVDWSAEAGKIIPAGKVATLETTGVRPGDYRIEASVSDGAGHTVACATTVTIDPVATPNASGSNAPHVSANNALQLRPWCTTLAVNLVQSVVPWRRLKTPTVLTTKPN